MQRITQILDSNKKFIEFNKDELHLIYYPQFISKQEANRLFDHLLNIKYNSDEDSKINIFGRMIKIPRKQVAFGDAGLSYKFSGNQVFAKIWDTELKKLQIKIQKYTNIHFNFVLVNYYKDGSNYIGWHSDDENDLASQTISSISLGITRDFQFRKKNNKKKKYEIKLNHGDLLIMKGQTNNLWQHSLPKRTNINSSRINLTYRVMKKST